MNAETFYPWRHIFVLLALLIFLFRVCVVVLLVGELIRLKECQGELLRALREVDGEDVSFFANMA